MRDVRGYRAYKRLRGGWNLIAIALIGIASSPFAFALVAAARVWLLGSLVLGLVGALLAVSGPLGGAFRWICLGLACNFGMLLGWSGGNSMAWLLLLPILLAGDRRIRSEMGLGRGLALTPPGCHLCLLVLPFVWPMALALGSLFLGIYLLVSYPLAAAALPKARDLADQLEDDPVDEAMAALTRI